MLEPHQSSEVWLFSRDLAEVTADELVAAIKHHQPSKTLPQSVTEQRSVPEVLALGDWVLALEGKPGGRDRLRELAKRKVLSTSVRRQRSWLSTEISAQPLHPLRRERGIPLGHLRALACMPNLAEREDLPELVQGIQEGRLTVRALLERLERTCGGPGCPERLLSANGTLPDTVVMIVLGRSRSSTSSSKGSRDQQRRYFCGVRCAHAFLGQQVGS